jgi:hypothetical protein
VQRGQSHWRGGRRSGSGAAPLGSASAPCAKFIERDHSRCGSARTWSMATQFPAQGTGVMDAQAIADWSIGQHPSPTQAPRPNAKTRTRVRATMIGLNLRMCILTTCDQDPQHPDDMRTVFRSILQKHRSVHLHVRSHGQHCVLPKDQARDAVRAAPVLSSHQTQGGNPQFGYQCRWSNSLFSALLVPHGQETSPDLPPSIGEKTC